jgi:hypothetical protein
MRNFFRGDFSTHIRTKWAQKDWRAAKSSEKSPTFLFLGVWTPPAGVFGLKRVPDWDFVKNDKK